jgi:hypothetical protein
MHVLSDDSIKNSILKDVSGTVKVEAFSRPRELRSHPEAAVAVTLFIARATMNMLCKNVIF